MNTAFLKKLDPTAIGKKKPKELGPVFVTSGTSTVGYRVVKGLVEAGHTDIRVGIWKGDRQDGVSKEVGPQVLQEFEALGLTCINFDWTKESSYTMSLAGIKTVFCTLPHMEAEVSTFHDFVAACRKTGVKHFVKTSVYTSYIHVPFPYVDFHRMCDKALTEPKETIPGITTSSMHYTILSSPHLMSTPLIYQGPVLRDEHKYITASYSMGVNYVSQREKHP